MIAPANEKLTTSETAEPATMANGVSRSILNALTVDVEDYYQVTGFENCVYRAEWDQLESRVVASTHKILDLLGSRGVRGTFFILGWVAERFPDLVRAIHAAGCGARAREARVSVHEYARRALPHRSPAVG